MRFNLNVECKINAKKLMKLWQNKRLKKVQ